MGRRIHPGIFGFNVRPATKPNSRFVGPACTLVICKVGQVGRARNAGEIRVGAGGSRSAGDRDGEQVLDAPCDFLVEDAGAEGGGEVVCACDRALDGDGSTACLDDDHMLHIAIVTRGVDIDSVHCEKLYLAIRFWVIARNSILGHRLS